MKPFQRIGILFAITSAIVMFWLVPGINKATADQYTRRYEDTDRIQTVAVDTFPAQEASAKRRSPSPEAKPKKVYKSESIRPKDKRSKLKLTMFSRGAQFVEEPLVVKKVHLDSAVDVAALDTAARQLP